ncbi:multiple epidermal growth factor-like domains protein 10 [Gigantopelta aegis]|uniref:multiple epidermal growth factor-like domains protein 10 n=1 Tax=Gigantopelta aegis TaxID=1735272 RepID=UPI001B88D789|nr:multiple epidermal growth factor-like domains protein 10 [Gigantopelta aegis]
MPSTPSLRVMLLTQYCPSLLGSGLKEACLHLLKSFLGSDISGACESGKYGLDCSYTCNCDAANCHDVTGCSGSCREGWSGPRCTTENVALLKTTYQSSYYDGIPRNSSAHAVDGSRKTDNGVFCILTDAQPYTWWEVDLGRNYYIHNLVIYFRTDYTVRKTGVNVYSSLFANQSNTGHWCGDTTPSSPFITHLTCDDTARYITLYRNTGRGSSVMDFCEVEVYVCDPGTFGDDCTQFCHCLNGPCNYTTGECAGGCKPNWTGQTCGVCDSSHYGELCSADCSTRHCNGSSSCDRITGRCDNGCRAGWIGADCKTKCPQDRYGQGCGSRCQDRHCHGKYDCYHVAGECVSGCDRGFHSLDCTIPCQDAYGFKCNMSCDVRHCLGSRDCAVFYGRCTGGCQAGWELPDCTTECQGGTFGPGCQSKCSERHCKGDSQSCDVENGTCQHGCQPGWKSPSCNIPCDSGTYGADCKFKCTQRHCKESTTSCNRVTGFCDGPCQNGWLGIDCTGCDGKYGPDCSSSCADRHCKDGDAPCDYMTGSCSGPCRAGWQGATCTDNCDTDHYGVNCESMCADRHCKGEQLCHHELGYCNGGCLAGWTGLTCVEAQVDTGNTDTSNSDSTSIAFAVVAGILFVLLVIVTSLFIWHIKTHRVKSDLYQQEMRKTNTNLPNQPTDPSAVEYEIVDRQDGGPSNPRIPSSQQVDTSRSANYGNSLTPRNHMDAQPRHSDSEGGYVNAGQTNEYEKLDLSNPPQNDYDRITGV